MTKYKCRVSCISINNIINIIFLMILLFCLAISIICAQTELFIILFGLSFILAFICAMNFLSVCKKYFYSDNYIYFSIFGIKYKRVECEKYEKAIISNASYNNGYGYGPNGNYPMTISTYDKGTVKKKVLPYISLHSKNYPLEKILSGSSSRDLFFLDSDNMVCVGICWTDSFNELLQNTNMNIYILEDVYKRYKECFDEVIADVKGREERCYIITNGIVLYDDYKLLRDFR